jgi:sugar/nucleoside kinase (ribokinase family)
MEVVSEPAYESCTAQRGPDVLSPKNCRIVVLGDTFFDVCAAPVSNLPRWDTDTLAPIETFPGGSAVNIASHGAAFCTWKKNNTSFILYSAVGSDAQGVACRSYFENNMRVINRTSVRPDEKTATCIVMSSPTRGRCFISSRGALENIRLDWFNLDPMWADPFVRHIHISGFFNMPSFQPDAHLLCSEARRRGLTTSLNPQYDAGGKWDNMHILLPYLSILIANADECCCIAGVGSNHVQQAALRLLELGVEIVVCTLGSQGARAYDAQGTVYSLGAVPVDVIDSTGAGDGFAAGFLSSFVEHHDLKKALSAGCLAGGAACTALGGSTVPSRITYNTVQDGLFSPKTEQTNQFMVT